jgi:hypothetical protein
VGGEGARAVGTTRLIVFSCRGVCRRGKTRRRRQRHKRSARAELTAHTPKYPKETPSREQTSLHCVQHRPRVPLRTQRDNKHRRTFCHLLPQRSSSPSRPPLCSSPLNSSHPGPMSISRCRARARSARVPSRWTAIIRGGGSARGRELRLPMGVAIHPSLAHSKRALVLSSAPPADKPGLNRRARFLCARVIDASVACAPQRERKRQQRRRRRRQRRREHATPLFARIPDNRNSLPPPTTTPTQPSTLSHRAQSSYRRIPQNEKPLSEPAHTGRPQGGGHRVRPAASLPPPHPSPASQQRRAARHHHPTQ